ncbi:MAG: 5'-methylthioadenosine/adenosylhomocysteine nucleosidase [Bacteroides sp.]|uniref:5'-methylthioadenosine/adenosylhomocysteine nucleosidase n=1 Tax=Bacteroides sp. TaxID=29523 RepID=UPI001B649BBF|nr:5'-methylthioadenosine/adenosylhomocysteine nucleosidase [Bacteroides sp.]MBP9585641.1 5'-methylthioadenosine/adenosylhomocysteine nucleosidase [Bacteroides sp.]
MRIGVISAMSTEHAQLIGLLAHKEEKREGDFRWVEGEMGGNTLMLVQSGIGKVNAAVGAMELIRCCRPDCVVSTGVAGGIDAALDVMDVVVSRQIVYHDVWCGEGNAYGQVQGLPAVFQGDEQLVESALKLQTPVKIHAGLICTGDQFITSRQELDQIKAKFPDGLAVDMESGAIAQVCYLRQVPFLSFRIISDTPGVKEHNQQYQDFWGTMAERSFKVTLAFLSSLDKSYSSHTKPLL